MLLQLMLCEVSSLCEETLLAAWEAKPLAAPDTGNPQVSQRGRAGPKPVVICSPCLLQQLPSFAAHAQAFKPEGLAKQSEFFLSPHKSEDLEREM